jgi:hypothetical protein
MLSAYTSIEVKHLVGRRPPQAKRIKEDGTSFFTDDFSFLSRRYAVLLRGDAPWILCGISKPIKPNTIHTLCEKRVSQNFLFKPLSQGRRVCRNVRPVGGSVRLSEVISDLMSSTHRTSRRLPRRSCRNIRHVGVSDIVGTSDLTAPAVTGRFLVDYIITPSSSLGGGRTPLLTAIDPKASNFHSSLSSHSIHFIF